MNILITGGAGFIGSNLCEKLFRDGHKINVIDNLLPQVHGIFPEETSETYKKIKDIVNFVKGKAEDICSWDYFFEKEFDVIICLAAETGTGQSMVSANSYCKSNIDSIALLNDMIVHSKIRCKKIILASSRAVYGDAILSKDGVPIATKESDLKEPCSIYAVTKLAQEQILFTGFPGVSTCALRFQNVYGPGQSLKNPYTGILSIFSTAIKNNKDLQIFDDGMMSRDFVYIDDVVESIIIAIENDNINGEVFNVGSGVSTTVLDVATTLKKKYNSNIKINITGEKMNGDIRHNFADISKFRKLGYEPKFSFDDGISMFVDWVQSQGQLNDNDYEISLDEFRKKGLLNK